MLAALLAHPDLRGALLAALVDGGAAREALSLLDLSRATAHADARELGELVAAWVGRLARADATEACAHALHARACACHAALLGAGDDLAHAARDLAFLSAQQRAVAALQAARGRLLLDLHSTLGAVERQLVARARRLQGDGGAFDGTASATTTGGACRHARTASATSATKRS
jgi:hypothetical protein